MAIAEGGRLAINEDCQSTHDLFDDSLLIDPVRYSIDIVHCLYLQVELPFRSEVQSPITALKVKQEHLRSLRKHQGGSRIVSGEGCPQKDAHLYTSSEHVPLLLERPSLPSSLSQEVNCFSVKLC